MNLNKLTKKQLLGEIKNLNARDSAWVRDYNKLQKKLDKADLEIYDLKMDKSNLQMMFPNWSIRVISTKKNVI